MTIIGSRHHGASDEPEGPEGPADREASHRRARVLSEVAAEGPVGLSRVLRRAAAGDADAAGIRVEALVRALPGMGVLDSHDLLLSARIRETGLAGELSPGQRVALVEFVDRARHLRESGLPWAASA
ncbi:hypothetical protein SAMN05216251_102130 [Actinacidiphila alni]|uniref:Uncharacterized protein n=1 Tax=Actinacidiphila alni TaxID=380248 RepID=A0A1I1YQ28_9ACTN|nr:hypothetical protein [Actinacidiphila alni]SFE21705.1 hypothetical protein SAMN05216251_102130 [Actinacidiphila alni]